MEEEELLLVILDSKLNRWDVIKEIDSFISEKYNKLVLIRKTYKIRVGDEDGRKKR